MKQEIRFSDAVGKILEGFDFSITCGQAVLTFTDGTFTTLGIDRGHASGDEEIEESTLELHDFGDEKLVALGVITQTELDEQREQRNKSFAFTQEKRERTEYERLRAKFES